MRVVECLFLALILVCIGVPVSQGSVTVTPANLVLPVSPGGLFSFDLLVSNPDGVSAQAFQSTINVTGPGVLTLDAATSQAIASVADYWVYGNSDGAGAIEVGGAYQFGDSPEDSIAKALAINDIMARYAFTWDGTAGNYNFALDLSTSNSFVLDDSFATQALAFTPGNHPGGSNSFTVSIVPEPATIILLALGSTALLKKRR